MTKYIKTTIIVSSIVLIGILIFATPFIQNKTATLSSSYEARKEDLLASQQQLESLVQELNRTLQIVQAREQNLSSQLVVLENKAAQPVITPTPVQPAPTPTPMPKPRAS